MKQISDKVSNALGILKFHFKYNNFKILSACDIIFHLKMIFILS